MNASGAYAGEGGRWRRRGGAFGRTTGDLSIVAIGIGIVALIGGLAAGSPAVVFGALAASFLFFAGLSAGGVAVTAAIRVVQGRWAGVAIPFARALSGFYIPGLLILLAVTLAARIWMPGGAVNGGGSLAFLVARDIAATAVLFGLGRRFIAASREPGGGARLAVIYLIVYAAVLSLWIADLVIGLQPKWAPSSVLPALFFMGAFLSGLAWMGLLTSLRRSSVAVSSRTRHDFGNLIFALAAFWAYLLWSSYLPVWYGNLPSEMAQLIARWKDGWRFLSLPVIAAIFVLPFMLLFPETNRGRRGVLAAGGALILLGLLAEQFLLVLPPLGLRIGMGSVLISLGIAIGVLGVFALTVGSRLATEESMRAGDA